MNTSVNVKHHNCQCETSQLSGFRTHVIFHNMGIGDRIKAVMEARGYTQTGLARDCGFGPTAIRDLIQNPKSEPLASRLYKIAERLRVSVESLLGQPDITDIDYQTLPDEVKNALFNGAYRDHKIEKSEHNSSYAIETPTKITVNALGDLENWSPIAGAESMNTKTIDVGDLPTDVSLFQLNINSDILNSGFPTGTVIGVNATDSRPASGQSVVIRVVRGDLQRYLIRVVAVLSDGSNAFFSLHDDERIAPHKFEPGETYEIVGKVIEFRLKPVQPLGRDVHTLIGEASKAEI